ncbi:LysR substrate-binding domain-containing protein [Williamsia sp.]|uniref:LysR substrate-binding domain-containing protein n=1 Tax=Williamsia sp. TaxID=1872085 RepID=UPI001A2B9229|nr:LysR substrate-binding domain-containing protein [Williamsia sp.]MBJ7290975.1 LysR family transcriptional regulator [Williamsia sp.]
MEISQRALEQFVAVADEEHIGRAAARLMMTQPPLTQAIQRLERAVGVELLERSRRGVRLTAAGRSFADDARQLLVAQRAAVERARRIADGAEGDLRVGHVAGLAHETVPRLLGLVHRKMSGVRVHLTQRSSAELVVAVRAGSLDIALARAPLADHNGVDLRALPDERLGVAVPVGHRLSATSSVRLVELRDERFALLPNAWSELGEQVQSACRRAGFAPMVAARADGLPGLLGHVSAGGCVALVPTSVAAMTAPGVAVIALADIDDDLTLRTCLVSRSGATDPMVDRVVALLGSTRLT